MVKNILHILHIDVVIEYSDNYSKTSGNLWQYYKYEPSLDNKNIVDITGANHHGKSFIIVNINKK